MFNFTTDHSHTPLDHDEGEIISLCPVLGKTHAQFEKGKCSKDLQQIRGKNLGVSYYYFGDDINIKYSKDSTPIGGCDIMIMDILASKLKFSYEMIRPTAENPLLHGNEVIFIHCMRYYSMFIDKSLSCIHRQ